MLFLMHINFVIDLLLYFKMMNISIAFLLLRLLDSVVKAVSQRKVEISQLHLGEKLECENLFIILNIFSCDKP